MASRTLDEAKAWFSDNWTTLSLLLGIFALAMFLRTYFGFGPATDPAFLVSGGSDSYYHKRIIDYVVDTGKHLVYDPLLGYPIGLRSGRPPLYDWSVAVTGIAASPLFSSVEVSVWYSFLFSTAVWGSLTIFPLFFLTKEAFGRRAGLLAAFFLAIMPAHIQRSPFSNADHDAYALFFAVTAFFFFLRALHLLEDKKWVRRWRKLSDIRSGLGDFFAKNTKPVLYSVMSAFSIAAIALAWKGFAYVIVIILVYFGFQLIVTRFRSRDPMGILICFTITVGLALLVAFPWYYSYHFVATWFDAPVILFVAAVALGFIFAFTRDYPWALVVPAVFITFGVGFIILAIIYPAIAQSFVSGAGYFLRTKTYETIAEAQAPNFSQLALAFGAVSFYLSLAGLVYSFIQIPKRLEPFYLFLVIWSGASIFMSMSAARFIFNAAPAFAMTAGLALVIVVDKLDFKSIKKSYEERRANKLYAIRKSIKLRHIGGTLFICALILLPNIWYGLDAGMPFEEKREYDQAIVDLIPEALRPEGIQEGSNFYLGAFGYSLPLVNRYWPAAWDWLTQQDADVYPVRERPAFLSWWDYGFEAVNAGEHPTVADNFLNGYQLAGSWLMAQGEDDGIALLVARLIEGDYVENVAQGRLSDPVRNVITRYGFDYEEVERVLKYPGSYVRTILDNPDIYDPYDSNMDIQNAMYIQLRVMFTSELDVDEMADFYHDIREVTGDSIKYFAVDSRLFPFSGSQTGIFYAPAKLSDHRMIENMPEDFFVITAETDRGAFYPHEVPIGAQVTDVRIEYRDMFYESMLYKTFVGYTPVEAGEAQNVGIPGVSGDLAEQTPVQAWNLTHFRVAYRTAYYNPYPSEQLSNHTDAWTAVNFADAIEYQLKINSGEMGGVVDASHTSSMYNGVIILEYYDGAYVNGTVTVDGVTPLSGAWVTLRDELNTVHDLDITDSEGHYSLLAPFGEITVQVSVGELQALTNLGATELNSVTFNVTDDQAMRRPMDADKDGILDYVITQDIEVEGGSLTGTVYLDRNHNTEYDEDEIVFPDSLLTFEHTAVNETWEVMTDGNGTYELDGAFPGDYEVSLEAEGRLLGLETVTVEREKELTKDINVTATSVTGIVRTLEEETVANATAQIFDESNQTMITTFSNADGNFSFENLLPGQLVIEVFKGDESSIPARFYLEMNENVTARINLLPFGTVSGRTYAGGKTAPYTYIEFRSHSTVPRDRFVWSDESGSYSVSLKEGRYDIYCIYDTGGQRYAYLGSTVVKRNATTKVDIQMVPPVKLTGTVYFGGEKDNTTSVHLESAKGIFVARTNALADYTALLPPGDYWVTAYGETERVHASRISLTESMVYDITLVEERRVAGYVYYDMNSSGDRQYEEGLVDALLTYTDEEGNKISTLTDDDGSYEAWLVPDEDYSIVLERRGFDTVTIPVSSIDDIEEDSVYSMIPKNITVSGQVLMGGIPLDQDNLDIEFQATGSGSISTRTRSFSGSYSVNLRPGDYLVVINQNISASGDLRYQNTKTDEIHLSIGQDDLEYDLNVVRRGLVSGTVRLAGELVNCTLEFNGPEIKYYDSLDGNYETFLALGDYTASSQKEHENEHYSLIEGFQVAGGLTLDLVFEKSTKITGLLRYEGSIVREALDITFQRTVGGSITISSENNGRYEGYLLWGDYSVHVDHSTVETVSGVNRYMRYTHDSTFQIVQGATQEIYDIQIEKTFENSTVSGTVTIGGVGTVAQVQFLSRSPSAINVTAISDQNGNYSVELAPGDYSVYVHRPTGHYAHLGQIGIEYNTHTDYDIPLLQGYRVSGVVTFKDGQKQVSDVTFLANGSMELKTDDLGRYELYLPEGEYVVEASTVVVEKGADVTYEASQVVLIEDITALNLELMKNTVRKVTITWDSEQKREISQGESVTYTLTVTNEGNVEDTFILEGYGPSEDWTFTYTPSKVVLDYGTTGNSATVSVKISTPANASVDHGPLTATVRSENSTSASSNVALEVDIKRIRGLEFALTTLPSTYDGTYIYYELELKNTGNAKEKFVLNILNAEDLETYGWIPELQDPVNLTYSNMISGLEVDGNTSQKILLRFTVEESTASANAVILCYEEDDRAVDKKISVLAFLPGLNLEITGTHLSGRDVTQTEKSDPYLYALVALVIIILLMLAFRFLRGRRR